jgi:hypothetical protein
MPVGVAILLPSVIKLLLCESIQLQTILTFQK